MTTDLNTLIAQGRAELARRRAEAADAEIAHQAATAAWWAECLATAERAVGPDVASHIDREIHSGFRADNEGVKVWIRVEGMATIYLSMSATRQRLATGGVELIWLPPQRISVRTTDVTSESYPLVDLHVALARAAEIGDQEIPF